MLKYLLVLYSCIFASVYAYDPSNLPKAYTEGIGAFEPPAAKPEPPAPPPEPSALDRVMNAAPPEPEMQSEALKSMWKLAEEPTETDESTAAKQAAKDEWQTYKKVIELEEKEKRREERRRRRRRNRN